MSMKSGFTIKNHVFLKDLESANLIVTGYGQHGKDTACEIIEQDFGLSFISSSMMACQKFLYKKLKPIYGYTSIEECFKDRHNKRDLWHDEIFDYNTPLLTRLSRDIFANHPIYCGARNRPELLAIKEERPHTIVIWVNADLRKPPESSSNTSITEDDADIILYNNEEDEKLNSLRENIHELMNALPKIKIHQPL